MGTWKRTGIRRGKMFEDKNKFNKEDKEKDCNEHKNEL